MFFMFSENSSSNLNLNYGYQIKNCLFIEKKFQNTENELKR